MKAVLKASFARRGFLRSMLAVPAAAKAVAESVTAQAAGIEMLSAAGPAAGMVGESSPPSGNTNYGRLRTALQKPENRAALRAMLYQQYQGIYRLDHDLASKKSFSLAAKVTFQRQRLVERDLEERVAPPVWARVEDFLRRLTTPWEMAQPSEGGPHRIGG